MTSSSVYDHHPSTTLMNQDISFVPDASQDRFIIHSQPLTSMSLKRRASPAFEGMEDENSRKRMKEASDTRALDARNVDDETAGLTLADELAQELRCGCCSELVYRPVLVMPCQHFFCGRY